MAELQRNHDSINIKRIELQKKVQDLFNDISLLNFKLKDLYEKKGAVIIEDCNGKF